MRGWCSESRNFAEGVVLFVRNSSFLVHSQLSTYYINQSYFFTHGTWMVNVKNEGKKLSKVVREFSTWTKTILKSKNNLPNITHRNRVIFQAYSGNSWVSLEGFSLSVCPPCFSDNYASLLAPKARCTATQTVRHATQTYSVSCRLADAFLLRPEDFRRFL